MGSGSTARRAAAWRRFLVRDAGEPGALASLLRRLDAERAVLPGAAHNAQRAPGFNEALERFLSRG